MKIALFHNLPQYGGAYRLLCEQVKYLSRSNEIYLYVLNKSNSEDENLARYVDKVLIFNFENSNSKYFVFDRPISDYKVFVNLKILHKNIAKHIDKNNYNVCLVHTDVYTESPYILRYLKTPNIYYCHELLRMVYEKELAFNENVSYIKKAYEFINRKIRKQIDKSNARCAMHIMTCSYYISNKVRKAYSKNSTVCSPGVDIEMFKNKVNINTHKILYIGGRNKLKGYPLAKESINLLENKVNLTVLGYGKRDVLIKDDNKLSSEYSRSLATICPSYSEPFGMVALESMACESPVLAVNEGGYKESVIDGVTGYLLPRDPKVFAEKIKFLMNNPDIARKMGKAGREHVKKNFTWEKHGKCLEKQLYEVAGLKRK